MRYIIGVGSHSEVIHSILSLDDDKNIAFLSYIISPDSVHSAKIDTTKLPSLIRDKYMGDLDTFLSSSTSKYDAKCDGFIIAIGDNKVRKDIAIKYSHLRWLNAIHPKANIAQTASMGSGNVICVGATLAAGVKLGHHNIINTNASIDHHDIIGSYCHVAPNCALCGNVTLYDGAFLGVGSSVTPGISVAPWSFIKANSLIKENTAPIPIYEPYIIKYKQLALEAIDSGWISSHGKYVPLATEKLRSLLGAKHVILLNNGTSATHALFLALRFKYPHIKTVYIPNNVYVAAWNCALMGGYSNLKVLKMNPETWNMNTEEKYIQSLDKNSAVLIVHNIGAIINVPRLKRIRPDLVFLEDNCEGLFGKYRSESPESTTWYTGTFPGTLCASLSFFGNKTMTCGEGGAIIVNDTETYQYLIRACNQGNTNERYIHDVLGYNYRITNIQAAFLYDQLKEVESAPTHREIEHVLTMKERIFRYYYDSLSSCDGIKLQAVEKDTIHAHWLFAVRVVGVSFKKISAHLSSKGIDSRPMFYPIETHSHLKHLFTVPTEIPYEEIVMLPSYPTLNSRVQDHIIDTLKELTK